jgi:hypothetical protein
MSAEREAEWVFPIATEVDERDHREAVGDPQDQDGQRSHRRERPPYRRDAAHELSHFHPGGLAYPATGAIVVGGRGR